MIGSSNRCRIGTTGGLALSFLVACGGGSGNSSPNTPANTPASPPPSQNQSTQSLVNDLLSNIDANKTAASPPSAEATSIAPQQAPAPSPGSAPLDTWNDDVARVKSKVPTWDNGTGLVLKFLKENTGERLTLIYVDPTPPAFQQQAGLWMIQAKANVGDKTVGHITLLLKDLNPGRFEGSPSKRDMIVGSAMGETWDGNASDTNWSINEGSWCEITLRAGSGPNDLEGDFRAKLVSNSGNSYHTIESGYLYINR